MLKTNFNKSSGNSKEDTFKSSSTIKVVDQESIRQKNSKPISRETQSNQHKHSKSVGKKTKKQKKGQKKNPISTKEFKQYQASVAEPQSKIATLERS